MEELDADMVADLKEAFGVFDRSKEGAIKAGVLRELLVATGVDVCGDEGGVDELLQLVNAAVGDIVGEVVSDDTLISFPHFVQLMANLAPPGGSAGLDAEADTVFAAMGGTSGSLSMDAFAAHAALLGDPLPPDVDPTTVAAAVDPEGPVPGAVSAPAFAALMRHS